MKGDKLPKQKYVDKKVGYIINNIILFNKKLHVKRKIPNIINKIIFFKLDAIGDAILSLPVLNEIKKQLGCKIVVVCSNNNKCIFENHSFIDKIISFKNQRIDKYFFSTIKQIMKEKSDIAIDSAQSANISAILSYISSKFCIGFRKSGQDSRNRVYDLPIEFNSKRHVLINYFSLTKKLGVDIPYSIKLISPNSSIEDETFTNTFFKINNKYIGISPCNEILYREWDAKKYIELIKYIINKGYNICLFGSQKESLKIKTNIISELDKTYLYKITDLSGKLNWKRNFACMKYLTAFIGNDGALCHVAASFNLPVLCIFSSDTPLKYAPFNRKSISVWRGAELNCSPCNSPIDEKIPGCVINECLKRISVEDMINAFEMIDI